MIGSGIIKTQLEQQYTNGKEDRMHGPAEWGAGLEEMNNICNSKKHVAREYNKRIALPT